MTPTSEHSSQGEKSLQFQEGNAWDGLLITKGKAAGSVPAILIIFLSLMSWSHLLNNTLEA